MISVVFATSNRASVLSTTLQAFCALETPAGESIEVIVVDNASTDGTAEVLARFAGRLPLRVLREERRGKNIALNRALDHCSGELVVFTDDDVLPEPDWLVQMVAASRDQTGYAIFGGTIRPHWLAPPTSWLFDWRVPLDVMYTLVERRTGPVAAKQVFGPNMAVRAEVLRAGHRFPEGVGPDGSPSYAMGSETQFLLALERAGFRAWFAADAVVRHVIQPFQLTEEWILKRSYRFGRGCGVALSADPDARGRWFRALTLLPQLLVYSVASLVARPLPPSALRLRILRREQWLQGVARAERDALVRERGS